MQKLQFITLLAGLCLHPLTYSSDTLESPEENPLTHYRATVKQLGDSLLAELTAALKKGPEAALEVCQQQAPQITSQVTESTGIQVGRTSLKVRNSDNAPKDWERTVLQQFETLKAAGEDPKTLEYYKVETADGHSQVRYMKAIPTAELCLSCHGTEIAPSLQTKLQTLYPNDQATGFKVGDLRGAFTLTASLKATEK